MRVRVEMIWLFSKSPVAQVNCKRVQSENVRKQQSATSAAEKPVSIAKETITINESEKNRPPYK